METDFEYRLRYVWLLNVTRGSKCQQRSMRMLRRPSHDPSVCGLKKGQLQFTLVNSAVLASIECGNVPTELAAAFLLPSHYVWLAKLRYDQHQWSESVRFGLEALKGEARLSSNGLVVTCRFLCLAGARVGDNEVFDRAIKKLQDRASDDWARSELSLLEGFPAPDERPTTGSTRTFSSCVQTFTTAIVRRCVSSAAIALARGDLDKAEGLAREAYDRARTNAYLVDMLLTVLIRKHASAARNSEIDDLFAVLERVGEEDGRSFYTTRRAEVRASLGRQQEGRSINRTSRFKDSDDLRSPAASSHDISESRE